MNWWRICLSLLVLTGMMSSQVLAADHVVISEIKVAGIDSATDEFVELYNPTNNPISLEGWRLSKKTSTGTLSNLVTTMTGTIPANGYFLITHPDNQAINADLIYSVSGNSVTVNNTILLYSDAGQTVVDKVGLGEAGEFETVAATHPEVGASIERKAQSSSNPESMTTGSDQFLGNGYDSDHNFNDFVLRTVPQPQNSQAPSESLLSVSPTPSPSPTPTPTPSPSPTPTPTPTSTPSPAPTPSPSPSVTPTPSPTPTPVPSPSPTPTPGFGSRPWPGLNRSFSCDWQYRTIQGRLFILTIPRLVCTWTTL